MGSKFAFFRGFEDIMKILNIVTNKVFDLPKAEAERVLAESPNEFVKGKKPRACANKFAAHGAGGSILEQIIE